ncbi:3-dehydroquinate synthase [Parafrankia elaeagni]
MVLVTSKAVRSGHARSAATALMSSSLPTTVLTVPDGERAKTLSTVRRGYELLSSLGFSRGDLLVSLGGGTVSDLAGFLASTWHRGTRLIHLPTTLLAQIDASVGGKNAVNFQGLRNAVGTFYDPSLVVIDPEVLASLSRRDFSSGMAEVLKCGLIADPRILSWATRSASTTKDLSTSDEMTLCIRAALEVKIRLVESDPFDRAERMFLNYGHTVGQAIESATNFRGYRHGEAVGLGMLVAARAGEILGGTEPGLTDLTRALLKEWFLPTEVSRLSFEDITPFLASDKKRSSGHQIFVMVSGPGRAELIPRPEERVLREAFRVLAPQGRSPG